MIKEIVFPLLTAILLIGGVLFHACNKDDVPVLTDNQGELVFNFNTLKLFHNKIEL